MLFSSSSSRLACAAERPVCWDASVRVPSGFLDLAIVREADPAFLEESAAARQIIAEADLTGEVRSVPTSARK